MADVVVVRLSPHMQASFRQRGVFPELVAHDERWGRIDAAVPKERAAELLRDAEAQHEIARGSVKKAISHFIQQLDRVLKTPAYLRRRRIDEAQDAARQRGQEWRDALKKSPMGPWLLNVSRHGLGIVGAWSELRVCGSIAGERLNQRGREEAARLLDQLEESELEHRFSWCSDAVFDLADETIAKARRSVAAKP